MAVLVLFTREGTPKKTKPRYLQTVFQEHTSLTECFEAIIAPVRDRNNLLAKTTMWHILDPAATEKTRSPAQWRPIVERRARSPRFLVACGSSLCKSEEINEALTSNLDTHVPKPHVTSARKLALYAARR